MKGRFFLVEFGKAVHDSWWDCAYGTGCVGTLLSNALQFLPLSPKHNKFQVPFRGPAHFHVYKREFVVRHDLNPVLFLREGGGGSHQ